MKRAPAPSRKQTSVKEEISIKPFKIVAIGASAGGLEAITLLLKHLKPDTGMCFIYVQHLSPDHKSILPSLLAKSTKMIVQEVKNMVRLEANNFYVIPHNKEMSVLDGHLKLTARSKERVHLPINKFFTSLAQKHKEASVGIILSGSATDGTQGLLAIKASGGVTFAQDDSAKFNSMPRSAVAAGAVDFVLPPSKMADELERISKFDYVMPGTREIGQENEIENNDPALKNILNLLLKRKAVDFSHYKMPTIKRRILRRMLLNGIKTIKKYEELTANQNNEIDLLYEDLLINVTSFFRDTDAHLYLKKTIFPKLLKSKKPDEKLRIWIPACSTGEEAYSFAMTILELQSNSMVKTDVQIFATDLSQTAIAKARLGEYTKLEVESVVSAKHMQRFYTKVAGKYRIAKAVRDICVFAPHNILSDPPFSRVDFISCCNLFIYLDTAAQKKVLSTFHYALNEQGYLMLGKSETIGSSQQLFSPVNNKFKIYLRKKMSGIAAFPKLLPRVQQPVLSKKRDADNSGSYAPSQHHGFDNDIDQLLLSRYVPAGVVINHAMEILQFRGETDLYLRHPTGKATLNILKMTTPDMAFELRHLISIAIKTNQPVQRRRIEINDNAGLKTLNIEVIPLAIEWDEPILLILFTKSEEVEKIIDNSVKGKYNSLLKDRRIKKLEEELAAARAVMHAYTQDQEAITEELQSANEEVVSSNEELQSINEELETSKEEIESTNEELTTTSQELQTRNELLNEAYEYSEALIATIPDSLLILDEEFRVISANEVFYKKFNVTKEETEGIILYDLGNKQWNIPLLKEFLESILPKNTYFRNFEVTHSFEIIGRKIILLNGSRIIQKSRREKLILLSMQDVTEKVDAINKIEESEKLYRELSKTLEEKIKARTSELTVANTALIDKNEELIIMNMESQTFAHVASHDLQEPLRKINILITRINEKEYQHLSEKGKDYFNRIQESARRMQTLIENLLSFSRLSITNREFEKVNLNEILTQVKLELEDQIANKNATITATKLGDLYVIPYQFRQLMYNLISNSLKFSKPAVRPKIVIKSSIIKYDKTRMANMPKAKEYCLLSISDNGIGFEPEFNEKIFEIFQRLHGKDEFAGTGIGLAIVKKIVENHNGIIKARGKLGQGTTFDMYIPTK